jgi:hypothetical protein
MAAAAVVAAGTASLPRRAQAVAGPAGPLAGSEAELAAWCLALAGGAGLLSVPERRLVRALAGTGAPAAAPGRLDALRQAIRAGADPLGDAFTALRPAAQRRAAGAVYTPPAIVRAMTGWLAAQAAEAAEAGQGAPVRIVDPGAGSGRFVLAAAAAFPAAQLVAVEADPLAALMLRANLQVQGCAARASVLVQDYRSVRLPACGGATAFIGNPPYVRHHGIPPRWKAWYTAGCAGLGIRASALAGLHLHFFLQTRRLARPGDVGAFITSAEWLDVNYGAALRRLLLEQLGGVALHVLEPALQAFAGTAATAAIACFRVGETAAPMRVRSVARLSDLAGPDALAGGTCVARARLQAAPRWSAIVRPPQRPAGGDIELGELFRVHRGQVTGANGVWIAAAPAGGLPQHLQLPCITRARELIAAGASLPCAAALRRVVDLPADLDALAPDERRRVEAFLAWARAQGAHQGYVARHRKAWWSVGLRAPAPILCTYMARRPPQFTVNACAARHINVAHGLYPRQPLPPGAAHRLVEWLNQHTGTDRGRTYAGGLTKFEPKEIERLRIPAPAALAG